MSEEKKPCPHLVDDGDGRAHCELAETGIGVFERKAQDAERLARDWQHEFTMYRNAWVRELGGKFVNKTHEIDSLVLTTRDLREERDRLRAAIIKHRSQKADDRCIEDDDELYAALRDGVKCDRRVGDKEAMLANCARFIERRCEGGGWPTYAELEEQLRRARPTTLSLKERVATEGFHAVLEELKGLSEGKGDGLLRFYIKQASDVAKNMEHAG
jgi:hypothetical protein